MEDKQMTGEEVIQEILGLLNGNGMQQAANNIQELCTYVDSMQHKMQEMTDELSEVREQLKKMQENALPNKLKRYLEEMVDRAEKRCSELKEQLAEVKKSILDKANEIVSDFKAKGKEALNKVSELLGVKEKLEKMREKVKEGISDTDRILGKIEAFGNGMREANQKIANTFRTFADKPEMDYSKKEKKFSKTAAVMKPWEWQKKVYQSVLLRLDAAIDKVDDLQKDVEIHQSEKQNRDTQAVDGMEKLLQDVSLNVAEPGEYQYNADAFEAAVKRGEVDMKPDAGQRKAPTVKTPGKGR